MHPVSGMHSLAVLYSYLGIFQGTLVRVWDE